MNLSFNNLEQEKEVIERMMKEFSFDYKNNSSYSNFFNHFSNSLSETFAFLGIFIFLSSFIFILASIFGGLSLTTPLLITPLILFIFQRNIYSNNKKNINLKNDIKENGFNQISLSNKKVKILNKKINSLSYYEKDILNYLILNKSMESNVDLVQNNLFKEKLNNLNIENILSSKTTILNYIKNNFKEDEQLNVLNILESRIKKQEQNKIEFQKVSKLFDERNNVIKNNISIQNI